MSAATATMQFRIARRVGRALLGSAFVIDVQGRENIPPGNFILASNHLGRLDPFVILAAFPAHPRIHFLAAWETSQDSPWKKFLSTLLGGVIPVRRGRGTLDEDALRSVERVLAGGGAVAIFPEGAYGHQEGRLRGPLRHGAAQFAFRSGRPILPVGLGGTSYLHWDRCFRVKIGPPIHLPKRAEPSESAVCEATERLAVALQALIQPADSNPPAARGVFLNQFLGRPGRFGGSLEPPDDAGAAQ